jgi:hypothetical protein
LQFDAGDVGLQLLELVEAAFQLAHPPAQGLPFGFQARAEFMEPSLAV